MIELKVGDVLQWGNVPLNRQPRPIFGIVDAVLDLHICTCDSRDKQWVHPPRYNSREEIERMVIEGTLIIDKGLHR